MTINTTDSVWLQALQDTLTQGSVVSPRGKKAKELLSYQTTISMSNPILTVAERQLGYRFMAGEAAWIMSGDNKVSTIKPFAKHISQFSDDSVFFQGAYGPMVVDQLAYVARTLANDGDSRQAVLTIWRPNPAPSKDIPCTVALQWVIRNGRLHCLDTMRSSDLWLGLPYDWFNMSCLSLGLKILLKQTYGLDVGLGTLTVTAGSSHIYEENWELVERILAKSTESYSPNIDKVGSVYRTYEDINRLLWVLARGDGALNGFINMEEQLS